MSCVFIWYFPSLSCYCRFCFRSQRDTKIIIIINIIIINILCERRIYQLHKHLTTINNILCERQVYQLHKHLTCLGRLLLRQPTDRCAVRNRVCVISPLGLSGDQPSVTPLVQFIKQKHNIYYKCIRNPFGPVVTATTITFFK